MASNSRQPEWRDGVLPELDVALQFLSGAKDSCGFVPAQIALATACVLLTLIRDIMGKKQDFVDLGLFCARVCEALDRGLKERGSKDLNESVYKAIAQLTATMVEIRGKVTQKGERGWFSAFLNARGDKGAIAGWKQELTMVLDVFQTELLIGVYVVAERVERKLDVFVNQEGAHQHPPAQARSAISNTIGFMVLNFHSILPGESPPPAPKDFFGRNDLIEEIIGRAEKLESIALIGAGGIGKTSIALTVLHSDRIKHRFGDNRRFLRCDKFPASRANFLAQLSNVIGSSIKDFPGDLTPLRPLLSSKAMILILDNAESILDPQGTDAEDIYTVVEELSQFSNICLGITSRITTIPPQFKRLNIHTLSLEAACDIFYSICGDGERSKVIDDLLQQLDCHALSIKLLATAASHNMWDHDRLAQEWRTHRAQALRTDFNKSLAASIELSLTSPTFRNLGPDARELLEVAAFFPQGINENNLDWLFPTIPNRRDIFDKFCILSLTSRSSGFITMLAPIRDYLRPQNPASSPLLRATKDHYFTRLSVDVHPEKPGFKESRWITSEDVNVEHLFNVFTPKDADSDDAWDICFHFLEHLVWHKPRRTVLGAKVEGLSNDHRSKPKCLFELARLFYEVGNWAEAKRLFTYTLQLTRQWGDDSGIAETLRWLGDVNRLLGYLEEAIHQAKGALEIRERLGDTIGSTRQKTRHTERSTSSPSRIKVNNPLSANLINFLAGYTVARGRQRRPFTTMRRVSKLHLLSTAVGRSKRSHQPTQAGRW
ncbi:hypothetical protein BJ322DRAFT_720599 [Thelephora terrestris]|uniref:NB-ARC domain-containing protein n=1 Tax=Thelephora terrestris TaxID=56493 RepID=A0A9P6HJN8_9AGAM|nr:hypothetical protein BJ322DRAFT_720599 [Thelephora terrestris]